MTKAIFFDVDGTLVSFKTHQISPAVRQALQALRDSLASLDSVQEVRILVNGELAQYYAGISLRTSTRATQ